MSCLRVVLIALLLCAPCAGVPEVSAAAPQQSAAASRISVRAKGRTAVVFKERGRAHTLSLSKHIGAARIEDVSVLFMSRAGGSVYLVLQVCGMSKLQSDDHECGAGIECNLVWLKLDDRWKELEAKSALYDSCWLPILSDGGPAISGKTLTLEYDDLREEMHYKVSYDADHPEKGFAVENNPLPKTAN